MKRHLLTLCALLCALCVEANVTLPAIFSDHMVLEQNTKVKKLHFPSFIKKGRYL